MTNVTGRGFDWRYLPVVLLLTLVAACAPSQGMNHAVAGHGVTDTKAPFDQQFIDMMVPHHEGAIEMAKVAATRAQRPEIRQMAQAIAADQTREVGQMKGWRKAWYGSDQTPGWEKMPMLPEMKTPMGNMADDVRRLQAASPVEKAFIDLMIPHHEAAVEAAQIAQQRAERAEIKVLAQAVIDAQTREIAQMKEWRKAWYGS